MIINSINNFQTMPDTKILPPGYDHPETIEINDERIDLPPELRQSVKEKTCACGMPTEQFFEIHNKIKNRIKYRDEYRHEDRHGNAVDASACTNPECTGPDDAMNQNMLQHEAILKSHALGDGLARKENPVSY